MNKTVSQAQLYEFSKYLQDHPAYTKILEDIRQDCFNEFIMAPDDKRAELSNIMKGLIIFDTELMKKINNYTNEQNVNG